MFETLIDQDQSVHRLKTILRKGFIPNALLLTGPGGIGKQEAALIFAMACNCTDVSPEGIAADNPYDRDNSLRHFAENPCGTCKSCRKIRSASHPDILHIKPSGDSIKIAQIRSLLQTLTKKPNEAKIRTVIIADAQNMNMEAGNALLKALEEPPKRTVFILTARQSSDLLPTIVSRCQHIRFNPISRGNLQTSLMKERGMDSTTAGMIAAMANGSLSKALMMTDPDPKTVGWFSRRNWLIREIEAVFSPSGKPGKTTARLLALAEKLAADKDALAEALDVINTFIRDLIIFRYDPEKVINKDLTDMIRYISKNQNVESLISKTEAIRRAQKNIQSNTALRLTLEVLMMQLARY